MEASLIRSAWICLFMVQDSHAIKRQERKVFLVKDQLVHLLAALEFISLSEQHGKDNIRICDSVHIYFWTK
jgi:hypothetical protein